MKTQHPWWLFFLLGGLFFFAGLSQLQAANISASGGWTLSLSSSNLTGGAGSDLTATYTSTANATILNVASPGNGTWRVYINRNDSSWPADFLLYAQRTSTGTGSGTISGGTSYQQITTGQVSFFTGSKNRTGINIRYQLRGASIQVSPGTYNTTVVYTITP